MLKVLVIEDELMIRKGLIYSFDWAKVNCVVVGEAENGEEGIRSICELEPDIIIVDINLPIISGIDMIKQTIEKHNYGAIIVSGYNEFEFARQVMKYGVSEYLLKPLDHEELEKAILNTIEQQKVKNIYKEVIKNNKKTNDIQVLNIHEARTIQDKVIKDMINFIEVNYMNKITMKDLLKELNYSEALLNRKFKKEIGTTFNTYLNRYRIQKSIDMIKEGNKYIYNIAEDCGFNNYKYFNTVFKKYVGYSANKFVELLKNINL